MFDGSDSGRVCVDSIFRVLLQCIISPRAFPEPNVKLEHDCIDTSDNHVLVQYPEILVRIVVPFIVINIRQSHLFSSISGILCFYSLEVLPLLKLPASN